MSGTSAREDTSLEGLPCGAEGFAFGGQGVSGGIFGGATSSVGAVGAAIAVVIVGQ